jgi:hypothetical protein
MNVEIGTKADQFLFREYFFQIFGIASLQCRGLIWKSNVLDVRLSLQFKILNSSRIFMYGACSFIIRQIVDEITSLMYA